MIVARCFMLHVCQWLSSPTLAVGGIESAQGEKVNTNPRTPAEYFILLSDTPWCKVSSDPCSVPH